MIRKGIMWAVVMVFLCSCFIFTTEFTRRPSVESICEHILSLPEYDGAQIIAKPQGAYEELYESGAEELKVYKTNDGTAKELAVMILKEEYDEPQVAIDALNMRTEELKAEFRDNEEELNRIDKARIVLANGFLIYTVYDTEGVAENAVYKYFAAR
ncbi:MAG: hypothetical protein UIM24_01615 [Clostridia bacterium]|nr:hypothetical protein [Clostridia bacterium]